MSRFAASKFRACRKSRHQQAKQLGSLTPILPYGTCLISCPRDEVTGIPITATWNEYVIDSQPYNFLRIQSACCGRYL